MYRPDFIDLLVSIIDTIEGAWDYFRGKRG